METLITELNEYDFNQRIKNIFPFIQNGLSTPHKKGKGILVESMERILLRNGVILNYFKVDDCFEDIVSYDNEKGLDYIYKLFFYNIKLSSDVLFFTPFMDTNNGNKGVVMRFDYLHKFLIFENTKYYKYGLDISSNDLFFYLYGENKFFGVEHNSPPYWLSL
ncbi:hypothetical protein ACETLH_004646 [Escherichia coli]